MSSIYYKIDDTLYEMPETVSSIKGIQSRIVNDGEYNYVDMSDFTTFEMSDIIDFLTREFNLEVLIKFLYYVKELDNFNFDAYSTRFLDMMNIFHGDNQWVPFDKFQDNFGSRKVYEENQEVAEAAQGEDFIGGVIDAYAASRPKRYVDISLDYEIKDYTVSKEEEEAVIRIYQQLQTINKDWADIMLYSITASQKFHKVVLKHGSLINKITEQVNAGVPPACYAFSYMILRMYLEETVDRRRNTPMKLYDEVILSRFPSGLPDPLKKVGARLAKRASSLDRKPDNAYSFQNLCIYSAFSPYIFFPSKNFFTPTLFRDNDYKTSLTVSDNSFKFEDNNDNIVKDLFVDVFNNLEGNLRETIQFWLNNQAVLTGSAIPSSLTGTTPNDYDILLPNDDGTKLAALINEFKAKYKFEVEKKADYKYHIIVNKAKLEVFSSRERPGRVISNFHVPCVRAFFDGKQLKFLPSFLIAMKTGLLVDYRYINSKVDTLDIIDKYNERGFTFITNKAETKVLKVASPITFVNDTPVNYAWSGLSSGYQVYKQLMTNDNSIIQAFSLDALYTLMKQ